MGRTTTEEGPDWKDDDREDGLDEDSSAEEDDDDREVGPDAHSSAKDEEEDDRDSKGNTLHRSKKAAACRNVSFSDPYNALGLAHL
ncbi:hypothetical protein ZIOFF_017222 [Zingiber officinale]|uniref:Uncharacterized protein n=1 Tax=Zingiber officinale TaxID=94328 RepID=A0A8J5LL58_ZINOF|nr:hypothetical protein ZIOFF_017222 [Zingiber officinale]